MKPQKITELPSRYRHLEQMETGEILRHINEEDQTVAGAVKKVLPVIAQLVEVIVEKLQAGGRLFYIGAGTSGRLGVLDASECSPTYGVPATMVVGLMAGGDAALKFGIEDEEDNELGGWRDLQREQVSSKDVVIGIAASGTTPYVVGALRECRLQHITTGCIVCNPDSPVALHADYPVEPITGPEFVTGSTRMKSGTAQKMVLNMISTAVMIRMGRVQDNRMVHMQISNEKLLDRGVQMLMEKTGMVDYEAAKLLLLAHGSVDAAVKNANNHAPVQPASKGSARYIFIIGAFFFIFGFITWINGTLIPYLRIACELEEWQAYLVTFAFYISYTVMALPSSWLLQKSGMVKGMSIGLGVMALGCLVFIPAALLRSYLLFLAGLFLVGVGLTLLQTAVNPYITLLGPPEKAAQRMSIMGICNKVAGILAPLVMGSIILKNAGGLIDELAAMNVTERTIRLDQLSHAVIVPYCVLTVILLLIAFLIRFAHLPDIKPAGPAVTNDPAKQAASPNKLYLLGFIAIFFAAGSEVLAGDTIGNYGLYHGFNLDIAKHLTSYTLACMMIGYIAGVLFIPRFISQGKAFYYSSWLGLLITLLIIFIPGKVSIACVALLGLANAMLWPAIWPQLLDQLQGKQLAKGAAILIMGIAGGALMPLIYGALGKYSNNQSAYGILIPAYLFLVYYSAQGIKKLPVYTIHSIKTAQS